MDNRFYRPLGTPDSTRPPAAPKVEGDTATVGYGRDGQVVKDSQSHECFAKSVRDDSTGNTKYYVKRAMSGASAGQLLNPQGLLFKDGDERRRHTEGGRGMYEFRRVNQESFDLYLTFLRTKNLAFYRQAARVLD